GLAGDDALHAIADSYRTYARRFPGRYSLTTRMAADGDSDYEAAAMAAIEAGLAVLRPYGLSGGGARPTLANLLATPHRVVSLEIAGAIGRVDRDRAFQILIDNFANGIRQQARS